MNGAFEVQHLESLNNVRRNSLREYSWASTLNVLILTLGFTCVAVGYVLSNTSREQVADWLGQPNKSIERPARATSVGETLSRISKTWLELVS